MPLAPAPRRWAVILSPTTLQVADLTTQVCVRCSAYFLFNHMPAIRRKGYASGGNVQRASPMYAEGAKLYKTPTQTIIQRNYNVPRTRGALAQTESKYFDCYQSLATIAENTSNWSSTGLNPGAATSLFTPVLGNDINNRISRKVLLHRIAIRGIITTTAIGDSADILAPSFIRLLLVQDTQTDGATCAGTDVMATPSATTTALNSTVFQNLANFGRFKMLKDKLISTGATYGMQDNAGGGAATASLISPHLAVKWTYRFKKPVLVRFNATNGGTTADIIDNSFHLFGAKSSTNFAHQLSYNCRCYYKDP